MVLVAVGQDDRHDVVEPVTDGLEVRQDQVDARVVLVGEQHTAVDDQQLAAVLEHGHVAADLTETAEREHAQRPFGQRGRGGEVEVQMTQRMFRSERAARMTASCSSVACESGSRTRAELMTPWTCIAAFAAIAPCV